MTTLALIGCGKMGGALLRGWLQSKIFDAPIHVLEPNGIPAQSGVTVHTDAKTLPAADIVVIAVKPQVMDEVCAAIKHAVKPDTLILSIAAGQTIASFAQRFHADQPIIRTMPNTPAAIGQGATVAVANARISLEQKQTAEKLLAATGLVEWIGEESLMDAVTALSGSGPAYIFLLIETLARAGEKAGLPATLATTLARQTVIGSAALAATDATIDAATLRKNVTSPGGTTEAALKILMNGELQTLFDTALAAATKRGKELAN